MHVSALFDPTGPPVPSDADDRVSEKLGGALGIASHCDGRWHRATRGDFPSTQKGAALLEGRTVAPRPELTHLLEIISPENRIVVAHEGERRDSSPIADARST